MFCKQCTTDESPFILKLTASPIYETSDRFMTPPPNTTSLCQSFIAPTLGYTFPIINDNLGTAALLFSRP